MDEVISLIKEIGGGGGGPAVNWSTRLHSMLLCGDKRLFLLTFCFYFMVVGFTYFSLHPELDKSCAVLWVACCSYS